MTCTRKHRKLFRGVILVLLINGFVPLNTRAGEGRIVNGRINLTVMFTYQETNINRWRLVFEEASRLLWNATEGQLALGTVEFHNCQHAKDKADIWIMESESGAFAYINGLRKPGKHITLFQNHASGRGYFALVHEIAHYALGLYDEYIGTKRQGSVDGSLIHTLDANGNLTDWHRGDDFFCVSPPDAPHSCIMDGGSTVIPNNGRTEFCTRPRQQFSTTHVEGHQVGPVFVQNAQEELHHESCWDTISRKGFGLIPPNSEPNRSLPGTSPPVNFRIVPDDKRVVLCIDRSGSMADANKMELARLGAKVFVDLLHPRTVTQVPESGDQISVVSFSTGASVNFSLTEVVGNTTKSAARNTISALSPSGTTAIGEGLQTSLNQITGNGTMEPGCREIIILLSDGEHNTGIHPKDVIPDLVDRKVTLFTIGVGRDPSQVDINLLKELATLTGGNFFFAGEAQDLLDIFREIATGIRNEGISEQATENIGAGEEVRHVQFVDAFSDEVTFSVSWAERANLNLTVISPSRRSITPSTPDPNVEFFAGENVEYYRIQNPEPGRWELITRAVSIPFGRIDFTTLVSTDSSEVNVVSTTDQDRYFFPKPMIVQTQVDAGYRVAGAEVTGKVTRPDRSVVDIPLFDDGDMRLHGDEFANDGIYSAIFMNYTGGEGIYRFDSVTENKNGKAIADLPFVEDTGSPRQPISIRPFVRRTSVTAILENVPNFEIVCRDRNNGNEFQYSLSDTRCVTIKGVNFCSGTYLFIIPGGETFAGTAFLAGGANPLGSLLVFATGIPNQVRGEIATFLGRVVSCKITLTTPDGRVFTVKEGL